MKVKELIGELSKCDPNSEVRWTHYKRDISGLIQHAGFVEEFSCEWSEKEIPAFVICVR